jgi:hypothetical protein
MRRWVPCGSHLLGPWEIRECHCSCHTLRPTSSPLGGTVQICWSPHLGGYQNALSSHQVLPAASLGTKLVILKMGLTVTAAATTTVPFMCFSYSQPPP